MCRSFSNKVEWVNKVEASLRTSSHNMTPPMAQLPEGASKYETEFLFRKFYLISLGGLYAPCHLPKRCSEW